MKPRIDIHIICLFIVLHKCGKEDLVGKCEFHPRSYIINIDSVLVTGDNLLGTFDKLEVAELSVKSLTMGASLGKLVPINDEQVEDLRKKFLG